MGGFTHLPHPKGMYVESFVKLVEDELSCQQGESLKGEAGFGLLLRASLERLAGKQSPTKQQQQQLQQAGMLGQGWDYAAKRVLNKWA